MQSGRDVPAVFISRERSVPLRQRMPVYEVMRMMFLARLADFLWNPWLLGLFLFTGAVCSFGSGFFQFFSLFIR